MTKNRRLNELGERKIIEEILKPRYALQGVYNFGNDCAFLSHINLFMDGDLVATTDPCPTPMASFIGFTDLYYWGWLLATINLSDLAAAGARPLGLLTSLILPENITVEQFTRLLDGIDECCQKCGTRVVGGNIKEGAMTQLTGTAVGVCNKGKIMSRKGCSEGDLVVVIGDIGLFWAGFFAVKHQLSIDNSSFKRNLHRNLLTPLPKVQIGQEIANKQLLTACLDNSDGFYGSLVQLANSNSLQMHIMMDKVTFPDEVIHVSSIIGIDPIRFSIGWGDWQLVGCVKTSLKDKLEELVKHYGIPMHVIGKVKKGHGVILEYQGRIGEMATIDSERFTRESWFSMGIESYIELLINRSLWKD